MSISGTRGIVRVSKNPECMLQAAMAVERVREPDFYESMTGQKYPGEYGERFAARRRGAKFEANLHQNDAALLRRAVGPTFGLDPDAMVVRNFGDEVPGPPDIMRAARLARTRRVLRDLSKGRDVPHLLIQPQLALPTSGGAFEYVSPDFMVFDPKAAVYVPGEEKSFILRDNVAEPSDLDLTRRQAAAQILALRAEAKGCGIIVDGSERAVFVFATPFGLQPAPAFVENLEAEVHEIRKALDAYAKSRDALRGFRDIDRDAPLRELAPELPIHFQEDCFGSCIMAPVCEGRHRNEAVVLGDAAGEVLGASTPLVRVEQLLRRDVRPRPEERELVGRLFKAAKALGLDEAELRRKLA